MARRRTSEPLRFIDNSLGLEVVQILPGHCYISTNDELLSTVLGSCISVCMYEPGLKMGGMNHYLLPYGDSSLIGTPEETRYGNHAIDRLITMLIDAGASRTSLQAKVFGGGSMFDSEQDVGLRNIEFAWSYLKEHNVSIVIHDVGLPFSRKVRFSPHTGEAMVKRLPTLQKLDSNSGHHPETTDTDWRLCG